MKTLTVSETARLSGISVRTLHHYDEIGLLRPASIGRNRYRYYGETDLLRLQQILFYREFGMALSEIAALLDDPGFDHVEALRQHRARLIAETERHRQLIATIDRTIVRLQGEARMSTDDLYKGFSTARQAEYEDWLVREYGDGMRARIDDARVRLESLPSARLASLMAELAACEAGLAEKLREGVPPGSEQLAPLIRRHRAWVGAMWGRPCDAAAYRGLADLYLAHPDFVARYETIAPGFAAYLATAMKTLAEPSQPL
jgi:DNA-binding transcriptional MerR regulator